MIKFEKMLVAFFICALLITNIIQVNADFSKSMYLTWGVQHASIVGEDLHLVLDKTSGEKNYIYHASVLVSIGFCILVRYKSCEIKNLLSFPKCCK